MEQRAAAVPPTGQQGCMGADTCKGQQRSAPFAQLKGRPALAHDRVSADRNKCNRANQLALASSTTEVLFLSG
eukprot:18059-Heterococcus_DN1.PRE.2